MFTRKFLLRSAALIYVGLCSVAGVAAHAASAIIVAGQPFTLSPTVDGTAPFTYQWYKNGVVMSGATASSYQVSNTQATNAGVYTVVISNSAGSTTSDNATITLATVPVISTQPVSQVVTAGNSVAFAVVASGSPTATFQWKLNGAAISGATNATLSIANAQLANAGTYTVVATNSAGSVTSTGALLTVNSVAVAPVFSTQPVSQTVTAGGSVTFTSLAGGSPAPSYQWRKNGTNISGATNSSYSIASATSADASTYSVVATNSAGSVTSNNAVLTVNSVPVITTQPTGRTVTAGASVTFTVAASGSPVPVLQWKLNGAAVSGATNATLTITNAQSANAGTYTVVATNSAGSATSIGAVLTVNAMNTAPSISTIANQSILTGAVPSPIGFTIGDAETAASSLTVSGSSSNPTLVPNANITFGGSGASRTATVTPVAGQIGTATITVTVSDGTASTSGAFRLTVNLAPPSVTAYVSAEAEAGTLVAPMTIASDVNASGGMYVFPNNSNTGTVTLPVNIVVAGTYVIWCRVLSPNEGLDSFFVSVDGGTEQIFHTASGKWAPTWQWSAVTGLAAGLDPMLAVGLAPRIFQLGVGLHNIVLRGRETGTALDRILVTNDPNYNPSFNTAPTISDIADKTINASSSTGPLAFTLGDAETSAISLTVTGSSSNVVLVPNSAIVLGGTGANRTVNITPAVGLTGTTTISVTASDALLTITDTFVLTVSVAQVAPVITTQPANQTVTAGNGVTFSAAASGVPTPTYQWRKNGTNISGATSAAYSMASVATGDAGTYTVVATNAVSSVTSTGAVLTVNPATSAPVITTQPASQTVTSGASVSFAVVASGSPVPTYQWRKNGSSISGASSATYTISNVSTGSAGTYTVVVSNSAGSVTSTGAVLTVNPATVAPSITAQPVSQTVTAGNPVTFSVVASGTPSPTYQWRKNGTNISGASSASYVITTVSMGDAGSYTVVATNTAGSATSNGAVLTVNPALTAPVFTTQPVSHAVVAGSAVTFTAVADGNPAPTYQWRKNGTDIAGAANASYSIVAAEFSDAGTYTVVATNSVGAVASSVVALAVRLYTPTVSVHVDFNGDGKADILWQNVQTGECSAWLMAGSNVGSVISLGSMSIDWQIGGAGDFNGDGKADILWQNSLTGECRVWLMANTGVGSSVTLGTVPLDWQIGGAGDFNGDGKADIFWQSSLTGDCSVWLMNGSGIISTLSLGSVSADWIIKN